MRVFPAVGPRQWRRWRTLRLAALTDAPDAFGSTLAEWQDATESRWRSRLSMPGALDLIAVADGRDVGQATGSPPRDGAVELISMWVTPDARRAGVAQGLIARVSAWAASWGGSVRLAVRPDNVGALGAYRRAGFVTTDEPGDPVPGTGHRELIMVRLCGGAAHRATE